MSAPGLASTRVEFPKKLEFLFEPHRHKGIYGGRDGAKSWSVSRALVLMGAGNKLRWLCARETQKSISESVHQLLEEQISRMGLRGEFQIDKTRITGRRLHSTGLYGRPCELPGYTEFVFAGLRHNVNEIKSLEGLDGMWIEEAQSVSQNSWDVVVPTVRKEGSEVWATWNPGLATDATHKRWILNPWPDAVVVKTTYADNIWLSETSRNEIAVMRDADPAKYRHIYGGECITDVEGSVFGREMAQVDAEHRIRSVPYNRAYPVDTIWDLGFGDPTSIWFVQAYDGWFHFIDYLQDDHLNIAEYVIKLQNRGYVYRTDWLPHDGIDTIIHQPLAGSADRSMSILELVRRAGRKAEVIRKMYITDQLNAARTIFPACRFDSEKCADGLQALRHYRWPALSAQGVGQRTPMHDWASHAASAFCGVAVAIRQPKAPRPPDPPRRPGSPWS